MFEIEGIYISERTVGNHMKDVDIGSVYRRKYRPASSQKTKNEIFPTILKMLILSALITISQRILLISIQSKKDGFIK